jgi:hypothetical protein
MSGDQMAGRNHSIKFDNSSLARAIKFKYFGTTLTNENSIQEEIRSRLKSGMLAIIRCRIVCLQVCYPKAYRIRYIEQ